jgi:hypothetical protein
MVVVLLLQDLYFLCLYGLLHTCLYVVCLSPRLALVIEAIFAKIIVLITL